MSDNFEKIKLNHLPKEHKVDVIIGGRNFCSYVYDPKFAKPYLGPLTLSNGESITRLDFATKEHPHQRSVFVAVGEVTAAGKSDVDFWNEPADRGEQRQKAIDIGDCGFTAYNVWQSADGVPMLEEARSFCFESHGAALTVISIEITFKAAFGEVVFGATKEAGPLGIRIAPEMQASGGNGFIVNSWGGRGEAECWGKCAPWAAYCGSVGGQRCALTVFDDPSNERFPTSWHCRDYGLFAVNNLFFKGPLKINAGDTLTYRFKIQISEEV